MKPAKRRILVFLFLGLLAVAQLLLIEWMNGRREPGQDFLAEGASLAGIEVIGGQGPRALAPADGKELQVLLVFSTDCPHCETVAPAWRAWTAKHPVSVGLLAVTGDALGIGEAYGRERGWDVDVATVPPLRRPRPVEDMLKRTPWLFLLDEGGTVIFERHGSQLAALDSAIVANRSP